MIAKAKFPLSKLRTIAKKLNEKNRMKCSTFDSFEAKMRQTYHLHCQDKVFLFASENQSRVCWLKIKSIEFTALNYIDKTMSSSCLYQWIFMKNNKAHTRNCVSQYHAKISEMFSFLWLLLFMRAQDIFWNNMSIAEWIRWHFLTTLNLAYWHLFMRIWTYLLPVQRARRSSTIFWIAFKARQIATGGCRGHQDQTLWYLEYIV